MYIECVSRPRLPPSRRSPRRPSPAVKTVGALDLVHVSRIDTVELDVPGATARANGSYVGPSSRRPFARPIACTADTAAVHGSKRGAASASSASWSRRSAERWPGLAVHAERMFGSHGYSTARHRSPASASAQSAPTVGMTAAGSDPALSCTRVTASTLTDGGGGGDGCDGACAMWRSREGRGGSWGHRYTTLGGQICGFAHAVI
ncbi:hypothetical protein B0H17DRAFT_1149036 [Mycena rosella]|uniref:Uncharacterized protein n=1 Tax=Mycena rosella TaxID=1033263 RepID=A0AAD7FUU3_MYCRO|nr:hypothetical protein B0H17DRAFT_1149036 [Mycena rosella]